MNMTNWFFTLLVLSFSILSLETKAIVRQISLSDLTLETIPAVGKLNLRDRKTKEIIFIGTNLSENQLMDIYHKYSFGRSIEAVGVANAKDVKFQIDDIKLNSSNNPQLGFKVATKKSQGGVIEIPAQQINPWIQSNGVNDVGTIKINREIILSLPILGDPEADDFLKFVNGVNAKRGSGKSTIKFDLDRFNIAPSNYWELIRDIKKD